MLVPVIHILPLTKIEKERVLPLPGRVVVRQGQKVAPRDVVAEAQLKPRHLLLNIAKSLGVSLEQADDLIQRMTGDIVQEGDLIAGPVGITRRVVRAPVNGEIMLAGEGQVLLRVEQPPFALTAGINGVVSQLIPERGVVIETTGALIQGVWGNGRSDFGLIQVKIENPNDTLKSDQIEVSLRGTIVLGGYCDDPAILQKAAEVPIRGLILTSMASDLIPVAEKMDFPILVLDGFGRVALNDISFKLLTGNQNRDISLNAEKMDRYTGARPEIIIPLPSSHQPEAPADVEELAVGRSVRITRAPYHAQIGTIEMLYNDLVEFPSGIRTQAAQIRLSDNDIVNVPIANLEIIA